MFSSATFIYDVPLHTVGGSVTNLSYNDFIINNPMRLMGTASRRMEKKADFYVAVWYKLKEL